VAVFGLRLSLRGTLPRNAKRELQPANPQKADSANPAVADSIANGRNAVGSEQKNWKGGDA